MAKVNAKVGAQAEKILRGQNPNFSAKEQALVNEANAKAEAAGRTLSVPGDAKNVERASAAQTARSTKVNGGQPVVSVDPTGAARPGTRTATRRQNAAAKAEPKVIVVATAPAQGATERQPHTKRAIAQAKETDKLAKAQARVDAALAAVTEASTVAKLAKRNDPERDAKFLARATAEAELLAARKALQALKREQMTPEERAAKQPAKKTAAPKAPRVTVNRTIKAGAVKYENAKGGWTLYMVTLALKHKDTDSATAAHKAGAAKAGQRADKPLDFKWMDAKGYIKLG